MPSPPLSALPDPKGSDDASETDDYVGPPAQGTRPARWPFLRPPLLAYARALLVWQDVVLVTGPTSDLPAAELAEAEATFRERRYTLPSRAYVHADIVLAELDRQRALIAAVLAECDEAEARAPHIVGGRLPAILPVAEIRDLLEGEGR